MTKPLDPDVKFANKIKFGKIRSLRVTGEGNPFFGRKHTQETKDKISRANKGVSSPRLGVSLSEETKEKIKKSRKGKFAKDRSLYNFPENTIPLSNGMFAIVDPEDYFDLSQHLWSVTKSRNTLYAHHTDGGATISMHHAIIGKPGRGFVIDHINGNGLDNRRQNLRIVTNRENSNNRHWYSGKKIVPKLVEVIKNECV